MFIAWLNPMLIRSSAAAFDRAPDRHKRRRGVSGSTPLVTWSAKCGFGLPCSSVHDTKRVGRPTSLVSGTPTVSHSVWVRTSTSKEFSSSSKICHAVLQVIWGILGMVSLSSHRFPRKPVVKGVLFRLSYFFCPGVRDAHRRRVRGPSHCD
jgi:hypothetical protein